MTIRVLRGAVGVLGLTAVLYQLVLVAQLAHAPVSSYLSFFTTDANLFAAAVLLAGALRPSTAPRRELLRGAATLYLLISGITYLVVVETSDVNFGEASAWVNVVLHGVMPIAVLLDWLVVPPRTRIDRRAALRWLLVPIAYFGYSLVRGYFTRWYPYPFLNPGKTHGYSGVFLTGLVVLIVMAGVARLVALSGSRAPIDASTTASADSSPSTPSGEQR